MIPRSKQRNKRERGLVQGFVRGMHTFCTIFAAGHFVGFGAASHRDHHYETDFEMPLFELSMLGSTLLGAVSFEDRSPLFAFPSVSEGC
jgi:hypothetical protein